MSKKTFDISLVLAFIISMSLYGKDGLNIATVLIWLCIVALFTAPLALLWGLLKSMTRKP